ncbi:MAG: T9SS type A sorting domain-containing protein [Paludibacter sp.]|nr:T9SS type A sorting domain-containing protein [Paludibacter sp.]
MTNTTEMPVLIQPPTLSVLKLVQNDESNDFYIVGIEDTALLVVSDLHCKVMLKQQVTNNELVSISSFRKGIYIAKIITETAMVEKKLVKK